MIQLIILDIKDRTRLGQMSNSFMRVSISFSLVSKKKKKKSQRSAVWNSIFACIRQVLESTYKSWRVSETGL